MSAETAENAGILLSSPQPGLLCIFCALRVPPFLILDFSELWEA